MATCYLGIGSNVGNRNRNIEAAIKLLRGHSGIVVSRISSIYETEPVSNISQGKFLNGVIEIESSLKPRQLLDSLHDIENRLGRVRSVKDGPRTIDLDILYYDELAVEEEGLIIPHPKISRREFVLKGLRELGKRQQGR